MILLFIITSILYLIMMFFVITLYYTYRKDIEEIENRLLQYEKRFNEYITKEEFLIEHDRVFKIIKLQADRIDNIENFEIFNFKSVSDKDIEMLKKEGDNTMACKRGKRKR